MDTHLDPSNAHANGKYRRYGQLLGIEIRVNATNWNDQNDQRKGKETNRVFYWPFVHIQKHGFEY